MEEKKPDEKVFDPAKSGIDYTRLLLGLATGKCKKSKTKLQKRSTLGASLAEKYRQKLRARALGAAIRMRQVSQHKFIVISAAGAELHDFKRGQIKTIDADSKVGRRYSPQAQQAIDDETARAFERYNLARHA